jgi:hypothetical protein
MRDYLLDWSLTGTWLSERDVSSIFDSGSNNTFSRERRRSIARVFLTVSRRTKKKEKRLWRNPEFSTYGKAPVFEE